MSKYKPNFKYINNKKTMTNKYIKILLDQLYNNSEINENEYKNYCNKTSINDTKYLIKLFVENNDNKNNKYLKLLTLYKFDENIINGIEGKFKGKNGGSGILFSLASYLKNYNDIEFDSDFSD